MKTLFVILSLLVMPMSDASAKSVSFTSIPAKQKRKLVAKAKKAGLKLRANGKASKITKSGPKRFRAAKRSKKGPNRLRANASHAPMASTECSTCPAIQVDHCVRCTVLGKSFYIEWND